MIKRVVLAISGIALVLSFAFVAAFWSHVLSRTKESSARLGSQGTRIEARSVSIEAEPIDPSVIVASEIGKAYHRPDCFYAAKQTKHRITFATRAEAEASGRHACTNCFPQIAHASDR